MVPGSWSTFWQAYCRQTAIIQFRNSHLLWEITKPTNFHLRSEVTQWQHMPQHLEITMQHMQQMWSAKTEQDSNLLWPAYCIVRLLSSKYTECLRSHNFMPDQVYNAINILKPFGTCLILLLSLYFPYSLIYGYSFLFALGLCWAITYISQGRNEGWGKLGYKYHQEMQTSSITSYRGNGKIWT